MKKKPTVYAIVLAAWACCAAVLGVALWRLIAGLGEYTPVKKAFIIALLAINTAVLCLLWLGSIKDFMFSAAYAIMHKKFNKRYAEIAKYDAETDGEPRFLLLYCTCNDFNAEALESCMRQRYKNFRTVILDDSSDEEYKARIDKFAAEHGAEVIRRKERKGYKAGNLNNYLCGRTDYDYFVVLDSDEVIPENYIQGVLK